MTFKDKFGSKIEGKTPLLAKNCPRFYNFSVQRSCIWKILHKRIHLNSVNIWQGFFGRIGFFDCFLGQS